METNNLKVQEIASNIHLFSRNELIEKFGWVEYTMLSLMLIVSLFIGFFFYYKGQKNNSDLLLGGKSMGTFPMTMSLIASFMSAITLLGTPAEMYVFGTQYAALVLSYPLVMAATCYLFLPIFYKLQVSTSYEYLEWRFNKYMRILASACFILQMIIYMSIVVYTPALALSQITGIGVDIACALTFGVSIIYTSIGGIKAVMWTDALQAFIMFASFVAVIVKGNYHAGGASVVFDQNYKSGRIELFNFDTDMTTRHTIWGLIFGGFFTWISIYGINQTQVQRYMSVSTIKSASRGIWLNMIGISALLLLCGYGGMVVYAYYSLVNCDPIAAKQVDKKDQIFPMFVMQVMGDIPCIPGILVAGVFSGALSTVSSGLNSLAAVTQQDFLLSCFNIKLKDTNGIMVSRGLAVLFGIISYSVVFLVKYLPGVLEAALGIFGIIGGPILGAFMLGMLFPWANSVGAILGTVSSLILTMWIGFGQSVAKNFGYVNVPTKYTTTEGCPESWKAYMELVSNQTRSQLLPDMSSSSNFNHLIIYEISYMWYSAIACTSCIVVGLTISLVYNPQNPRKINPDLISPPIKNFLTLIRKKFKYFEKHLDIGAEFVYGIKETNLKSGQINTEEEDTIKAEATATQLDDKRTDDGRNLNLTQISRNKS